MPQPAAVSPAPAAPSNGAVKPAPVVTTKPTVPAPGAPAAEVEPTFEVTVDGKPAKLTRRQIEKYAGKGAFADQLIDQAKKAIAATKAENERREALKKRIKEDKKARAEFLREHGLEEDDIARERLSAKLSEAEMTPEQRAIKERDDRIAALEAEKKSTEEEQKQQRLTANAQRIQARIETELDAAWERAGFKRGDADTFFAVYEAMKEFHGLGLLNTENFGPADADRICEAARENIDRSFKSLETAVTKGLKGKALYDRLGKSVVDELNRYQIELVRGGGAKAAQQPAPVSAKPASKPDEYLTLDQARAKVREMGK